MTNYISDGGSDGETEKLKFLIAFGMREAIRMSLGRRLIHVATANLCFLCL